MTNVGEAVEAVQVDNVLARGHGDTEGALEATED